MPEDSSRRPERSGLNFGITQAVFQGRLTDGSGDCIMLGESPDTAFPKRSLSRERKVVIFLRLTELVAAVYFATEGGRCDRKDENQF